MNVTEVKVKLVSDKMEKLKAFCSVTIDGEFVVRDIKVIEGTHGCFLAMPSRKLMDRCPSCGGKNHVRAAYCNDCGATLRTNRVSHDEQGRPKLHADIAHPIKSDCRDRVQKQIIEAYEKEVERSRQPGYVASVDDDEYESGANGPGRSRQAAPPEPRSQRPDAAGGGAHLEKTSFSSGIL